MLLAVRHRTASARLDALWDYDPGRQVVDIVLRLGSAEPLAFSVLVCHPQRPRFAAHTIVRVDGESWRILPTRFSGVLDEDVVAVEVHGVPVLPPRPPALELTDCRNGNCLLHAAIGAGTQLILTNTPSLVDIELAELAT